MATYRIAVRYSTGELEYRYSEQLPKIGDTLGSRGVNGTVSDVSLDASHHVSVTVHVSGTTAEPPIPTTTLYTDVPPSPNARERILEAAYDLFSRRGIGAVGMEEVVQQAGVSKATLYRHFRSKADLARAFLELRERRWTREWVENGAQRAGATPDERLLGIFDVFDGWFRRADFEGCAFINVLLETAGTDAELNAKSRKQLRTIRAMVRSLAEEAELPDPDAFAHEWHLLMKGSIVAAGEGDVEAAQRAQSMGRLLLADYRERPGSTASASTVTSSAA